MLTIISALKILVIEDARRPVEKHARQTNSPADVQISVINFIQHLSMKPLDSLPTGIENTMAHIPSSQDSGMAKDLTSYVRARISPASELPL